MKKSHLVALVCLWASTADATIVQYFDDDELFARADIVAVANVWRHDLRSVGGGLLELTDYELEASECFKGCQAGQFFMMSSPGVSPARPLPGAHEIIPGAPHPDTGERLIVYLQKQPSGDYHLISLGLSLYRLRYHAVLHRYIAHRETETIVALRPGAAGRVARSPDNQVVVPADSFASDVIDALRKQAGRR